MSQLAQAARFDMSIRSLEVNVVSWLEEARERLGDLRVDRAVIASVPVGGAATARVALRATGDAGLGDEELGEFMAKGTLHRVRFSTGKGDRVTLAVGPAAWIEADDPSRLRSRIRESVLAVAEC